MEAILSTLGLNVPGFVWHLVNFLVLLFLLRLVLYKPVTNILDERARRVRESMERAEDVRRQAEQAEADRQALLQETRREAELIRQRADEQAKHMIAAAEERTKEAQARIIADAEARIKLSEQQMLASVRAQVADMVVTAVDRVTRHAVDAQAQRALVQQFLTTEGGQPIVSPSAPSRN